MAARFVVTRRNWRPAPGGRLVRLPGGVPVGEFPSAEAAEADRRRREDAARGLVNPFATGDVLGDLTDLPDGVFRDWVREAGVDPPAAGADLAGWRAWWQAADPGWTSAARARVWDGLTKARFYAVEERPGKVGYAVVRVLWRYNDVGWDAVGEGGEVGAVYRTRAGAERASAALTAAERARHPTPDPPPVYGTYSTADREVELAGPFAPVEPRRGPFADNTWDAGGVEFFEVVEVDLDEGDG